MSKKRSRTQFKSRISRRKKAGTLKAQILTALRRRDMTAPELVKQLKANPTHLYLTLRRMQKEKAIKVTGRVKGRRGRVKRYGIASHGIKKERVSLGVSRLDDLTVSRLLQGFSELAGREVSIVQGKGGRAGKKLHLQVEE